MWKSLISRYKEAQLGFWNYVARHKYVSYAILCSIVGVNIYLSKPIIMDYMSHVAVSPSSVPSPPTPAPAKPLQIANYDISSFVIENSYICSYINDKIIPLINSTSTTYDIASLGKQDNKTFSAVNVTLGFTTDYITLAHVMKMLQIYGHQISALSIAARDDVVDAGNLTVELIFNVLTYQT